MSDKHNLQKKKKTKVDSGNEKVKDMIMSGEKSLLWELETHVYSA